MRSWTGMEPALVQYFEDKSAYFEDTSAHGVSRAHVPLLDKAIKLTWTLRDNHQFAEAHLTVVAERGWIETNYDVGEDGRRRVSDTMLRALRGVEWPPQAAMDDPFYTVGFRALTKLHELGVHQEAAEEMLRTRYHDMERWNKEEGCAAEFFTYWVRSLLSAAHARRRVVRRSRERRRRWRPVPSRCLEGLGVCMHQATPVRYGWLGDGGRWWRI
jgi:hypothetical protein